MANHLSMTDTYDAFLFELLGVEENGMELSVLSALARSGLDPWTEAKRLASLPRQAAIAAISALFNLSAQPETAKRLAELLPRAATPQSHAVRTLDREALFRRYGLLVIVAGLVAVVAVMMYAAPSTPGTAGPTTAGPVSAR
ncbi:MAG TPA: hypothetical protein VL899_11610 [Alphaproteobacteria bacterium]|jgi:hypothetical protein|nr:hypothetical protein [Alphaproteobacteria bacterium]